MERAKNIARAFADYTEDTCIVWKRACYKHSFKAAAFAMLMYGAFVGVAVFRASRDPDLSERSTASTLRSFEGSSHPFVIPVYGASAKKFSRADEADDVVRSPCERLSAHEASSNLYEPKGGAPTRYVVSNLFDVGARIIAGRENSIALPKLYNISGAPCAASPRPGSGVPPEEDHLHPRVAHPNPCIMTMMGDSGEALYAVNPGFTPAGRGVMTAVLMADETFQDMEPRWRNYYERINFSFKDWQTMRRVEEEVWGIRAYTIQAALGLLLDGKTIYDAPSEAPVHHRDDTL